MRDDPHQTVLTTGLTSLFIFGTEVAPLSDGIPSRWHHLGFIVDDLEKCYYHLREHGAEIVSDFTLLERDERWSLYCHYRNGDVVFMLQFSEIREGYRGVNTDATAVHVRLSARAVWRAIRGRRMNATRCDRAQPITPEQATAFLGHDPVANVELLGAIRYDRGCPLYRRAAGTVCSSASSSSRAGRR